MAEAYNKVVRVGARIPSWTFHCW